MDQTDQIGEAPVTPGTYKQYMAAMECQRIQLRKDVADYSEHCEEKRRRLNRPREFEMAAAIPAQLRQRMYKLVDSILEEEAGKWRRELQSLQDINETLLGLRQQDVRQIRCMRNILDTWCQREPRT